MGSFPRLPTCFVFPDMPARDPDDPRRVPRELQRLAGALAESQRQIKVLEGDIKKAKDSRNTADKKAKEAEARATEAEKRAAKAEAASAKKAPKESGKELPKIKTNGTRKRRARIVAAQLARQQPEDIVPVLMGALRRVATKKKISLSSGIHYDVTYCIWYVSLGTL